MARVVARFWRPRSGWLKPLLKVLLRVIDSRSATQRSCSAAMQRQRRLDRQLAVGKLGPGGFVVGLDGGPIFGERELEADVGVGVAVGDVMDDLAHGPAAVAVGRVELGVAQALDGGAKLLGKLAQSVDVRGRWSAEAAAGGRNRPMG